MKNLVLRLVALFFAVASVGLTICYVGVVVWGQELVADSGRFELEAALIAVHERLGEPHSQLLASLQHLASELNVRLTVVGDGIPRLETSSHRLPHPLPAAGELLGFEGEVFLVRRVEERYRPWTAIVASRSRPDGLARVYRSQTSILMTFMMSFVAMVGVGLSLAQRSLVAPLRRLARLVAEADHEGLLHFSKEDRGLASLGRDISAINRQLAEDREQIAVQLEELQGAHAELSQAQAELLRSERLAVVGKLAAGLAHELGNPLAIVGGFIEHLGDSALPVSERRRALGHVEREVLRMQKTLRNLLDFSRVSSEAAGSASLTKVLEEFEQLLAPQRDFREIVVDVRKPEHGVELPIQEGALLQVLLNLALNAAAAMKTVTRQARLQIQAEVREESVTLVVEDSGPGISSDVMHRISEPFFTTKPAGQGTGLGLSVCERIIESADGRLEIGASRELGGASFRICFPLSAHAGRTRSVTGASSSSTSSAPSSR